VYVVANIVLDHWFGATSSHPVSAAFSGEVSIAIASFLSGAILGGRIRTESPQRWGAALGGLLVILLALPSFLIDPSSVSVSDLRSGTLHPTLIQVVIFAGVPIALAFAGSILGVRTTARGAPDRGADA
jgi:hypothetical protein